MADKDYKMRLSTEGDTSGAKAVEEALENVEDAARDVNQAASTVDGDELAALGSAAATTEQHVESLERVTEQLNQELRENKTLTSDQVANLTRMRDGAERLTVVTKEATRAQDSGRKSTANFGLAALEASRAYEDLQYGIRGVLNNIPGLIMMLGGSAGLTAVISIAAVAGTQLFTKLTSGAKETEKAQDAVNEKFEEALALEKEIQKSALETLKVRGRLASERLEFLAKERAAVQAAADAESKLEIARTQGAGSVAIGVKKIELARIEYELSKASGEDAVRLARLRDEAVRGILDLEDKIAEKIREQELAAQQKKARAAEDALGDANAGAQSARSDTNDAAAEFSTVARQLADWINERYRILTEGEARLLEMESQLEVLKSTSAFGDGRDQIKLEGEIRALRENIATAYKGSEREAELKARAQVTEERLQEARANERAAQARQDEAARAMEAAALSLESLQKQQEQVREQRSNEREVQEAGSGISQNQEAAQSAREAGAENVGLLLESLIRGLGEGAERPGAQSAIQRIRTLLEGGLDDSETSEVVQLAQQLAAQSGTVNAQSANAYRELIRGVEQTGETVAGFERTISNLVRNLKATADRVSALEQNAGNPNP